MEEITDRTHVHAPNPHARKFEEDGAYDWRSPRPPDQSVTDDIRTAREFWTCHYCGSMHPKEVVRAIEHGARFEWADRKYGWPHKVYVHGAPNRYAGMMEIRSKGPGDKVDDETPARKTARGKFYTLHLQDATDEERQAIERAIGLSFTFEDGKVKWKPAGRDDHEGSEGNDA